MLSNKWKKCTTDENIADHINDKVSTYEVVKRKTERRSNGGTTVKFNENLNK